MRTPVVTCWLPKVDVRVGEQRRKALLAEFTYFWPIDHEVANCCGGDQHCEQSGHDPSGSSLQEFDETEGTLFIVIEYNRADEVARDYKKTSTPMKPPGIHVMPR